MDDMSTLMFLGSFEQHSWQGPKWDARVSYDTLAEVIGAEQVKVRRTIVQVPCVCHGTHGPGKTGKTGKMTKKNSLSGKTQGIWKFCQNTGKTQGILSKHGENTGNFV